jgi:hypothetical protein
MAATAVLNRRAIHPEAPPGRDQQGGARPFAHVTVEPGGTTTVVFLGGGASL